MRQRNIAWWLGAMLGAAVVFAMAFWPARQSQAATDAQGQRQPVLVELFTSEGCSSCPPADVLLAKLDEMQPVPEARVIVLSEHVTYWDHDGWRDPYSLDAVTDRQQWYEDKFKLNDVYTPQAVVDGAAQMLGSDATKLVKAVAAAAAEPKQEIAITGATWAGNEVRFSVHDTATTVDKSKQTFVAALAEDETETSVKSGENAGKHLRNVAVVRVLKEFSPGTEGEIALKVPSDVDKNQAEQMRLVVFLADKRSGHVLGISQQKVAR